MAIKIYNPELWRKADEVIHAWQSAGCLAHGSAQLVWLPLLLVKEVSKAAFKWHGQGKEAWGAAGKV